jgi:mRNA interferase RelE/StbE
VLCEDPTVGKDDTIKPLEGKLTGLWRYRIGDYRLIYHPVEVERRIVLLSFSHRSSAYS